MDEHPGDVGQQLLRDPVRLRVGAVQEPRRRPPVEAEGRRRGGHRARRARPVEDPLADDADDGPRAPHRPDLRRDLAALPREPGRVRGRVRPRVVQADPPRHGPGRPLPRAGGAGRDPAVAGPAPRGDVRAHRRRGHRPPQGAAPRLGPVGGPARRRPPGRRRPPSAAATSAAAPTARASASNRRAAGRSTTPTSWRWRCAPWRVSRRPSTPPRPAASRSRSPT